MKIFLIYSLTGLVAIVLIFITGCEEEEVAELAMLGTLSVAEITSTSAKIGGNVHYDGGVPVESKGVVWGNSENPSLENNDGESTVGEGVGQFIVSVTGLSPATTYYVRGYATNSEGIAYSPQLEFTTRGELVTVTTAEVTGVTTDSAVSGGNVEDDGGLEVTARGVVWSTTESPDVEDNEGITEDGTGTGEFESDLTGLSPATTYYVRAYATNDEGTSYGDKESFTTESEPVEVELPVVVTASVSDITFDSAISGGNVEDDGGAGVTARGVVWSTSEDPTVDDNEGMTEDGTGTGEYRSDITGLSPATTYYVRAYATNEVGTVYGNQLEFTTETEGELPTVTTRYVRNITDQSATSGGNVTDDGGLDMIDRGVVWGLSDDPTVEKNEGMTNEGPGTGQYTSSMTLSQTGTIYYVRAWAENAMGVSYGEPVSFKTYDGSVTDIDGNKYNTVIIGEQEWMVTNLRTTTLNDGTSIDEVTNADFWAETEDPAYSWYENYGEKFADVYGALYNFHTVATGDLCPDGWRVPLEADWEELIDNAGGQEVAGGKLKDTQYWKDPNEGATNEYRFTARPGGMRDDSGEFQFRTEFGYWWAYGYIPDAGPRFYWMHYEHEYAASNALDENSGLSVRCVKGDPPDDPPIYIHF